MVGTTCGRKDDDSHPAVINRLCAIVEDIDEDQAATVFEQAQKVRPRRNALCPLPLLTYVHSGGKSHVWEVSF